MSQDLNAKLSDQVLLLRVRNNIIEYLELASSFEAQRAYQAAVEVSVPSEVIDQWEDSVPGPDDPTFVQPVFSPAEKEAIRVFHRVWGEVATATPTPLPQLDEVLGLPAWERLRVAATEALRVFLARGKLAEDHDFDERH